MFFLTPVRFSACIVISFVVVISPAFAADSPVTVVYPTGIWPDDGHSVSVAVDAGGMVLLKAVNTAGVPTAFNYGQIPGDRCRTRIALADVRIVGERFGSHRTTIEGGCAPFFVDGPVKVRIEGIDFDGPLSIAIQVLSTTGIDIVDNHILSVVPRVELFGSHSEGIVIDRAPSQSMSGSINIIGNTVDNLAADFEIGIQVDDSGTADVRISENTVTIGQTPGTGTVQSYAIVATHCHGQVRIENNEVRIGPSFVFAGIGVAGDHNARYRITNNHVVSTTPVADGIMLFGGLFSEPTVAASVDENVVEMTGSEFGSISLYGDVIDSSVRENRISGTSGWAFGAQGFFPFLHATSNRFLENKLVQYTSSVADVVFDQFTSNNVVDGNCGSVLDLGVNNQVSCGEHKKADSHFRPRVSH